MNHNSSNNAQNIDSNIVQENTMHRSEEKDIMLTMGQYGYPLMTFHSTLRSHTIAIELDIGHKQALVNTMDIKHDSPIELTLLLKRIENELIKVNVTTIVQQVTSDDWKVILKPLKIWKIIAENNDMDFMTIACRVDMFAEAVMNALGFESPKMNT